MKLSFENGSLSGHRAAKRWELRIATAGSLENVPFSMSGAALALERPLAKPLAASVVTSPAAASTRSATALPSTCRLSARRCSPAGATIRGRRCPPFGGGDHFGYRDRVVGAHSVSDQNLRDEAGQITGVNELMALLWTLLAILLLPACLP